MDKKDFELDEKENATEELVETEEEKERNKKWLWLLLLLLLFISIGGIYTFSYFEGQNTGSPIDGVIDGDDEEDEDDSEIKEKDYEINGGYVLVDFEETNYIRLKKAVPLPDEVGLNQEDNIYSFTIKNNGTTEINYEIILNKVVDKTTIDSSLLNYVLTNNNNPTVNDIKKLSIGKTTTLVVNHTLKPNESRSYDLRIWLDKRAVVENASNKVFTGYIDVNITTIQGGASLD